LPAAHLLHEGTPFRTWQDALDVAARMGLTRSVLDAVLADDAARGAHSKIEKLLVPAGPIEAQPVAVDPETGWGALRLARHAGRSPLALARDIAEGGGAIIVQHPYGGPKEFVLAPDASIAVRDRYVHYRADTTPGASGAPVFDTAMMVIAVHYAAGGLVGDRGVNLGARIDRVKEGITKRGLGYIEGSTTVP
jgi:hypothetical protein